MRPNGESSEHPASPGLLDLLAKLPAWPWKAVEPSMTNSTAWLRISDSANLKMMLMEACRRSLRRRLTPAAPVENPITIPDESSGSWRSRQAVLQSIAKADSRSKPNLTFSAQRRTDAGDAMSACRGAGTFCSKLRSPKRDCGW